MGQKAAVLLALALVLALPFLVRMSVGQERSAAPAADALKLIIVTPHVEQIREEFGPAFDRWHFRNFQKHVVIDWRTPGGTSDIIKQLEATFDANARKGLADANGAFPVGSAGCDLFFGGGSFEHGKMKEAKTVKLPDGRAVTYRMGRPAGFEQKQLDDWFGDNVIGVQNLYDPEQYWIGTALSGFGIVYNRDVLQKLNLKEPRGFEDLCDPGYANMLALADGRQSGSITTTYDSILNKYGWEKGWQILREMSANARYFASAATRVPVDVGQGESAAGLSIDFYGRGQAQFLLNPGDAPESGRVGYIDPEGAVYIDADPVSMLNGAPSPDLAKRFVEFCLTPEAQAMWQLPPLGDRANKKPGEIAGVHNSDAGSTVPIIPSNYPTDLDGRLLGPAKYQLRRMPVRRMMYDPAGPYLAFMVDKSDPFTAASNVKSRGWRSAIPVLMACFGIDTAHECREAWVLLNRAKDAAKQDKFPESIALEMQGLFDDFPPHTMRDGSVLKFSEANFQKIKDDTKSWKDPDHGKRSLIAYTRFYKRNYERIIKLARENGL